MKCFTTDPEWTFSTETGTYTRPLLASEASNDLISTLADGCAEPYMGVTFTCKYSQKELVDGLREALGRLRFYAPLLAATITGDIGQRLWHYKCAESPNEVVMWAERSLEIHEGVLSPEDFVPVRNQMKLPYKHGIFNAQYFGADLLCHGGESYSLLIHGTHAIFDGQVTLDTTQCLFRSLTAPDSEPSVIQLAWGTEWKHLAAGIVAAMGGAPKGWKEGVPALSQTFQEIVQNPVPSLGLHPARQEIAAPGQPVRARHVVNAETSSKLLKKLREHGFTVTVLFEAALILAIFDINKGQLDKDAHVTFDITIVALQKYIVPPHDPRTYLASALSIFPLVVHYADIPPGVSQQSRLLAVMGELKAQYTCWLANPYVRCISSWVPPATNANPYTPVITNVGVVERSVDATWPLDTAEPDLEVTALTISHRQAQQTRPSIHLWSIRGELHIQLQCSDIWSKRYFEEFLEHVVGGALMLLEAPSVSVASITNRAPTPSYRKEILTIAFLAVAIAVGHRMWSY